MERLGDEALRVLRLAAVCGREFDVTMVAGDTLVIDTDWGTAQLTHSGVTTSVRNKMKEGSTWFSLEPGTDKVKFTTTSGTTAKAKARYANAYVGA